MPPAATISRLREVSVEAIAWVNANSMDGDQRIASLCSAMPRILLANEGFHIQDAGLVFVQ